MASDRQNKLCESTTTQKPWQKHRRSFGKQLRDLIESGKSKGDVHTEDALNFYHGKKICRLPEIILNDYIDESTLRASSQSNTEDIEEYHDMERSFSPLYYLFDVNDAKTLLFATVMKIDAETDWRSSYKVHSGPSAYISAILILNIITYDCGKFIALENAIRKVTENEIMVFYKPVIEIFKFVSSNSNDSGIAKQSRSLGSCEISSQIIIHASEKDDIDDECILFEQIIDNTGIGSDLKKKVFSSPGQMASNEMLYHQLIT